MVFFLAPQIVFLVLLSIMFILHVLLDSIDPERWTNIPLLVKLFKLVIGELSSVMEANISRQSNTAEWNQGNLDIIVVSSISIPPLCPTAINLTTWISFRTVMLPHLSAIPWRLMALYLAYLDETNDMWEDQGDNDEEDDDDDDDEGLAGQLLSDMLNTGGSIRCGKRL